MHHVIEFREASHEEELKCFNGYRDTTAYQEGFPPCHLFENYAKEQTNGDKHHYIHDILY